MSAEPAVGHGVGWGMENKAAFFKSREFEILGVPRTKACCIFKKCLELKF
jgi:hypothetical protein